jgi:hypothetical protein
MHRLQRRTDHLGVGVDEQRGVAAVARLERPELCKLERQLVGKPVVVLIGREDVLGAERVRPVEQHAETGRRAQVPTVRR